VNKTVELAAERAIVLMHDKLGEQVTVDDMARAALFSKFHFTRVFERATGVSPRRFLSALRLQRAQQLLVATEMSVADISFEVGYNSVGTFSSRFSRSIGLSPTEYRRAGGCASRISECGDSVDDDGGAVVCGTITARRPAPSEAAGPSTIFVGLFAEPIPQGRPVRCAVLREPGPYCFRQVPAGAWFLLAHAVAAEPEELSLHGYPDGGDISVGRRGPITVHEDTAEYTVNLGLRPVRAVDPPVLLALSDVRASALARAGYIPAAAALERAGTLNGVPARHTPQPHPSHAQHAPHAQHAASRPLLRRPIASRP